jgi:hypothetical protein
MRTMEKFLKRKHWQLWIVMLAILWNALTPSISYALSTQGGNPSLIEICTSTGSKFISIEQTGAESSKPIPKVHIKHCLFCFTHSESPVIASSFMAPFVVLVGQDLFPSLFYHSPTPLFSWSRANPRAPPSFS